MTSDANRPELENEKTKLEIEKLKKEIGALSLERWKLFLGFIPLVALLGTIAYQLYAMKSEQSVHEDLLLKDMSIHYSGLYHASSEDLRSQLDIANHACHDKDWDGSTKGYYCQQVPLLESKIQQQKELDNLQQELQMTDLTDEDVNRAEEIYKLDSIRELKAEEMKSAVVYSDPVTLTAIQAEISNLDERMTSIIDESVVIKKTLTITDSINLEQEKVLGIRNQEITTLIDEKSWFKKGYYRQFGETRITLENFESDIATISLKQMDQNTNKDKKMLGTLVLEVGEKEAVSTNQYTYEIVFQRIGSEGKNPFTKAVFFRYTQYQK